MCKTTKPTMCEVEGCTGKTKIQFNQVLKIYVCRACRAAMERNGTVERQHRRKTTDAVPETCQNPQCGRTDTVEMHRATGLHLCQACRSRYRRNGELGKPRNSVKDATGTCEICRTRKPQYMSMHGDNKQRCHRCYVYKLYHGKERPRNFRTKTCNNCDRPLPEVRPYCNLCTQYRIRNGKLPSAEHIARYAPHGWCECGKPATKRIDLRTGALYVHPTKTGTSDVVRAEVQEWAEWVCDECAGYEAEMQHIDGNEYRPGALIARE